MHDSPKFAIRIQTCLESSKMPWTSLGSSWRSSRSVVELAGGLRGPDLPERSDSPRETSVLRGHKEAWKTHTHNCYTTVWILIGTIWVSWYQKKHSPTHTCRRHQSSLIASTIHYDPWHPSCSIYVPDSIFHNLSPSFLWSTSWLGTLHFILL